MHLLPIGQQQREHRGQLMPHTALNGCWGASWREKVAYGNKSHLRAGGQLSSPLWLGWDPPPALVIETEWRRAKPMMVGH